MPKGLDHILDYFYELKTDKPISYQEIESWARLTNTLLTPMEVRALRRLDLTFSTTQTNG